VLYLPTRIRSDVSARYKPRNTSCTDMYLVLGKSTGSRLRTRLLDGLVSLVLAVLIALHVADVSSCGKCLSIVFMS